MDFELQECLKILGLISSSRDRNFVSVPGLHNFILDIINDYKINILVARTYIITALGIIKELNYDSNLIKVYLKIFSNLIHNSKFTDYNGIISNVKLSAINTSNVLKKCGPINTDLVDNFTCLMDVNVFFNEMEVKRGST